MGAPQSLEKIGERTSAPDGKIKINVLTSTSQSTSRRQGRQERCNRLPAPFQYPGRRRIGLAGDQRTHPCPQGERDTRSDIRHPGSREWNGNARRDRRTGRNPVALTHRPALEGQPPDKMKRRTRRPPLSLYRAILYRCALKSTRVGQLPPENSCGATMAICGLACPPPASSTHKVQVPPGGGARIL